MDWKLELVAVLELVHRPRERDLMRRVQELEARLERHEGGSAG
jgi:hypothetical protein